MIQLDLTEGQGKEDFQNIPIKTHTKATQTPYTTERYFICSLFLCLPLYHPPVFCFNFER